MKQKTETFNQKEKIILQVIGMHRKYLSVCEISRESKMSWITAKKYCERLIEDGLIIKKKRKYQINYKEVYGKNERK